MKKNKYRKRDSEEALNVVSYNPETEDTELIVYKIKLLILYSI